MHYLPNTLVYIIHELIIFFLPHLYATHVKLYTIIYITFIKVLYYIYRELFFINYITPLVVEATDVLVSIQ